MDWKEHTEKTSFSYEIVDENTFKFSYTSDETGKLVTVTYTRVK